MSFQILTEDLKTINESALSLGIKPFIEVHTSWYLRTDKIEERTEFGLVDPDGYLLRFTEVGSH